MKHYPLLLFIVIPLLFVNCKSKQFISTVSTMETTKVLCGTFVIADSSGILDKVILSDWNVANCTTPFDAMAFSMLENSNDQDTMQSVRPPSRYFIGHDTLYIEMDKGYMRYKIKDKNTLEGISFWNEKEQLIRVKKEANTCPKTHLLTAADKTWLQHSRAYYECYYSQDYDTALLRLEQICEEGYGPACMTLGLFSRLTDEKKGMALLEKACEMGYFGSYACVRLGETLSNLEKNEAAKLAYQKACDGGHLVGCIMVEMLNY